MSTIRVPKRRRYTSIAREAINDERLSFRARGLLAWLLDKPDDWKIDSRQICRRGTEGRDAIRTALRELSDCGYLVLQKRRDPESGRFVTESTVFEVPSAAEEDVGRPVPENPARAAESPVPENPSRSLVGKPGPGNPAPENQALKTKDCEQKTVTEKPSAATAATKPTDDPVKRHAHELAVLAFEQPVKPVIKGEPHSAFPATMALFERQLRAGTTVQALERAIRSGIDVWTQAGVQTAVARTRGGARAAKDDGLSNLLDEMESRRAGASVA